MKKDLSIREMERADMLARKVNIWKNLFVLAVVVIMVLAFLLLDTMSDRDAYKTMYEIQSHAQP